MKKASSVDEYISLGGEWQESLHLLRELLLSTSLVETVKWGMPVYTLNNKNVVGFSAFKAWTGLWFFQGVFLKDPEAVLINAQEGTTKGLRQWRFSSEVEIREYRTVILDYLEEAIQNQMAGKEIKAERSKALNIPQELEEALSTNPSLKESFEALSLSKRREYAEHIGGAKREETRQQRLQKIIPMILEGIGLSDKYRKT
jgi:uncharacterized protein YdeI (YjbR/CyaY-like superfamily)